MRSLVRWSILVACLVLAFATAGFAGTPQTVQLQIRLQDAVGNPVPDGNHALILTGWNDSVGGTLLWTQNQTVTTQDGLSQCLIQSPAVAAMLAHSGQQYIQMQVAGEAPLVPRIQLGSVPSALLTTRMDGDIVTRPGKLHITNPGSGDPDFDLLRIAADSTGSSIHMAGGDPDFDLLRVSAAASTGSITVGSGDPDFDLLRITGGPAGSSMTLNGGGDPDFDLLRVSAAATTGSITVGSGDPDFDLLRITGSPSSSSVILNPGSGDPDFDLLRITADNSGGSIAIGEEGVQRIHVTGGNGAAALSLNGLPPGTPVGGLITMEADSTGGSIAIEEEGVQIVKLHGGGGGGGGGSGGSIAVNEDGTHNFSVAMSADSGGGSLVMRQGEAFRCTIDGMDGAARLSLNGLPPGTPVGGLISMEADGAQANIEISESSTGSDQLHIGSDPGGTGVPGSMGISIDEPGVHLSIDCRETTTGMDVEYRIGNDLDGDGVPDGAGIAIDEEGHQRLKAFLESGGVVVVLDGMSSGSTEGGKVTTTVDSTGSTMTSEFNGVPGARLTVKGSRKTYNFFEAWPCGVRDVEVGTQGVTMSCTPGGSTTPDTAVQIDPAGDMTLAGDLSVGGDICAVGTIGACSDVRYKTDVTQLEGALAQLVRIRGVNFNWRTDVFPDKNFRTDRDFGFIAQELKEVVPQVVTLGKDGYYSVDYGRLTPILVEAVKELDAKTRRIDELESRLAALEAQMMKLAAGVAAEAPALASSR